MQYSSQLLFLANVLSIIQASASPQITQAPHPYAKRDDSQVTLNIGPITQYQKTTVSKTKPPMGNTTN